MACRLCVIYVSEDNDSNVWAMITQLVWTTWIRCPLSSKRPLNLITRSFACQLQYCRISPSPNCAVAKFVFSFDDGLGPDSI